MIGSVIVPTACLLITQKSSWRRSESQCCRHAARRADLYERLRSFPASVEVFKYVVLIYYRRLIAISVCYFLKQKSDEGEALKALIKFYAQHGTIIREIHSDQGGEYRESNETFCHHGEGGTLRESNSLEFYFQTRLRAAQYQTRSHASGPPRASWKSREVE